MVRNAALDVVDFTKCRAVSSALRLVKSKSSSETWGPSKMATRGMRISSNSCNTVKAVLELCAVPLTDDLYYYLLLVVNRFYYYLLPIYYINILHNYH